MHPPRILLLCVAGMMAGVSIPFTAGAAEATSAVEISARPSPPLYRPLTLGLEAGTTGLGASVGWRFANHWGARTGFDYLPFSQNNLSVGDLHYDAKLRLLSEPLTFDIYPWKKHSFRASVGVLFNQNLLTGTATDARVILGDAIGTLSLRVEQQPVAPYLGIGGNFFYFDHAHRWAMGGELGVAYTGDPKVSLTSSASGPLIDAAVRREQGKAQDWANQFKWFPVVKLQVSYAF
jgi:hypothetical protein